MLARKAAGKTGMRAFDCFARPRAYPQKHAKNTWAGSERRARASQMPPVGCAWRMKPFSTAANPSADEAA